MITTSRQRFKMIDKIRQRSQQLSQEFKHGQVRTKNVGAASAGISITLWLIVVVYLFIDISLPDILPSSYSFVQRSDTRDYLSGAIFVVALVCIGAFASRIRLQLNAREMLATILGVELVLFISICFMTGILPTNITSLIFVGKWFAYLQIFLLFPWIGVFLMTHFVRPPRPNEANFISGRLGE